MQIVAKCTLQYHVFGRPPQFEFMDVGWTADHRPLSDRP